MTNEKASRDYDLQDRLIDFAVRVMSLVEALPNNRAGNHVAGSCCVRERLPRPIMVRRRVPNRARISSIR